MNLISKLRHLVYAPPVLCGPYFFLTEEKSLAVEMRQRMLREAFPHRPRWQWGSRFVVQTCAWYLFAAWLAIWKSIRLRRRWSPCDASNGWHLGSLLFLALWYGADPRYYYIYRLYKRPQSEWLDFVFPQELPNWHLIAGKGGAEEDRESLADKHLFSQLMEEAELPSIPTLQRFEKAVTISELDVFQGKSRFFKPNKANASRGCFELHYDSIQDYYRLIGKTLEGVCCAHETRNSILACLQEQVDVEDYLVQPVIKNHPQMADFFSVEGLITFRVITTRKEGKTTVIYVVMEVPTHELHLWVMGNVDPTKGRLLETQALRGFDRGSYRKIIEPMIGHDVPFWEEMSDTLCRAHELFPNLVTIGWDGTVAESGPLIIEGNSGWDVMTPQEVSGRPMLSELGYG